MLRLAICDDSVTAVDALMALQAAAEVFTPSEIQQSAADVDQSGSVNSLDALKILQYAAEQLTSF